MSRAYLLVINTSSGADSITVFTDSEITYQYIEDNKWLSVYVDKKLTQATFIRTAGIIQVIDGELEA